jgi:sterol desaturase/sphingolipid hydroxylase (fatty acid hydroxylase superfamily)
MAATENSGAARAAWIGAGLLGALAFGLLIAERRRPLRRSVHPGLARKGANVALGIASLAVVAMVERPVTQRLAARAERERKGLVQRLPLPPLARDLLAVVLTDYAMYLWHRATHHVPVLWRFHLVHHIDHDLDATTALRFHAVDMAISAPVRYAQVALIGASPRALALWQSWFFGSVLFHHSNVRLPLRLERWLSAVLTTPRMHGIHHSAVEDETNSNWSSGLALWDHLHGTYRLDIAQDAITIGVPAYRDPEALGVRRSLALPFVAQADVWAMQPAQGPARLAEVTPKGLPHARPASRTRAIEP